MSGFFITRRAGGADVPGMYHVYNTNLDDYFAPENIEFFMMQWPRGQFVAEAITGGVVGSLSSYLLEPTVATITLLAVDAPYRSRGAGSALLDAFILVCMGSGISRIQLEARVTNSGAIRFYERKGFTVSGIIPGLYSDGGDAYRLILDVSRYRRRAQSFFNRKYTVTVDTITMAIAMMTFFIMDDSPYAPKTS